jgi:WD40 repeat protein
MAKDSFKYHLFISYTRTPDQALAHEIERFLESFHQTVLIPNREEPLPPLSVCLDSLDFGMPPMGDDRINDSRHRNVVEVLYDHLKESRELLILCSEASALSLWVKEEIQWFMENRGPGAIRLAFTEGNKPWLAPEKFIADPLLQNGLNQNMAYDFRGYDARRSREWYQVPEFNREMVKLASHLNGFSPNDLYPAWLEAEIERVERQSLTMATTARFETLAGDPAKALLKAYEAHEIHPSEMTEKALRNAYKVALFHHQNRREIAMITGAGPGYLAGRWKQGEVFSQTSTDGRYRIMVTERGKDGGYPPGEVYLISHETQKVVSLISPQSFGGRVEEVAFDRDSNIIFVSRYFNLSVFSVDGNCLSTYAFSRHTKSPIHLLAGYFGEKYILGAETKGGIWLVDPTAGHEATIQVLRERHGDAATQFQLNTDGNHCLMVFESGKVAYLPKPVNNKAELAYLPMEKVRFACFNTDPDPYIFTVGADGILRKWDREKNGFTMCMASEPLAGACDWISIGEDGKKAAVVGANQQIFVVDMEKGIRLAILDFREEIDWTSYKAVKIPHDTLPALQAATPLEEKPFSEIKGDIQHTKTYGQDQWAIVNSLREKDSSPTLQAWKVEQDRAFLWDTYVSDITLHGNLYWLHSSLFSGSGGRVLWKKEQVLYEFLGKDINVKTILEAPPYIWLGTHRGLFRHDGRVQIRLTPELVDVEVLKIFQGKLWVGSKQGAYLLENESIFLLTAPFIWIRDIQEVAGNIWLLTRQETGGWINTEGPAYLVEGYFAQPIPFPHAKVLRVLEAQNHSWIIEERAIHRWDGQQLQSWEGLKAGANELVIKGHTLWATTIGGWPFASAGPVYQIDLRDNTLMEHSLSMPSLHREEGREILHFYHNGKIVKALLGENGLEILETE